MASRLRLYYDAVVAAALMAVVAIVCGLIVALITGDSPPNFPVATIAFVLKLLYNNIIANELMAVVAIVYGLIVALITGDSPPNFPVATIAFVLICAFIFLRLSSRSRTSAFPLG